MWHKLGVDPEKVIEHLWNSSLLGLTFVTEEGKWLNPSPTLCELLEYTQVELEKLTYMDVTHPADVSSDVEMAKAVARGDLPYYTMSKRYIAKTGRIVWIKLHVSGFFMEDGKFNMFLSQIAPAEVFNPKAPAVVKLVPVETRIWKFLGRNWKWLIPALVAAAGGIYEATAIIHKLIEIAQKNP